MKVRLRCLIGLHKNEFKFGNHNKYYECVYCGKRKVKVPSNGYQPINKKWLKEQSE